MLNKFTSEKRFFWSRLIFVESDCVGEIYLYNFSSVYVRTYVRSACVHPSGFARAITSTFVTPFQYNSALSFSLRSRSVI